MRKEICIGNGNYLVKRVFNKSVPASDLIKQKILAEKKH